MMSQGEIAGGPMTLAGELPAKGHRFPEFEWITSSGRPLRLSDYRGRFNLVLVFADDQKATVELLGELGGLYGKFKSQEAEIIAVVQSSRQECAGIEQRLKLPYAVLPDEDGRIHRAVGASGQSQHAAAAVYVTDRYGEVFAAYRTRDGQTLPPAAEILSWLAFINIQCPECEPPEWPA